jgi:hypothetical protein
MHAGLQHRLDAVWGDHQIAGKNNVTIVAASAGRFQPRPGCATPALWLYLVGHYRTYSWTQAASAAVAALSSGSCAFVVAFMPDEIDASAEAYTPGALGRVDHARLHPMLAGSSVPSLLRRAANTTFAQPDAPSFAYAVVRRSGLVARYPACLMLYWHGIWSLSSWAARQHGFRPAESSVVVRTRPDVLLTRPLVIGGLRAYFEGGLHGKHLALGQQVNRPSGANEAQSDVHAIFSYRAYETDVARPIEASSNRNRSMPLSLAKLWWQRGHANGWALGRSIDEYSYGALNQTSSYGCPRSGARKHSACGNVSGDDQDRRLAWIFAEHDARATATLLSASAGPNGSAPPGTGLRRCMDRCLCFDGSAHCSQPSCMLTVAESIVVKTDPCNEKVHSYYAANAVGLEGVAAGARAHGHAGGAIAAVSRAVSAAPPSCVLRSPLLRHQMINNNLNLSDDHTHARALPLLGPAFDLTARVVCYCNLGSSSRALIEQHHLACNLRHTGCRVSEDGTRLSRGFFRCTSAQPLRPEASVAEVQADAQAGGATSATTWPMPGMSNGSVWPRGCGGAVASPGGAFPFGTQIHGQGHSLRVVVAGNECADH